MLRANLLEAVEYNDENIVITELLDTSFSKEIRIAMQSHQVMRDHESEQPVTLSVIKGVVNLSAEGNNVVMQKGDVVALSGSVKHHIEALEDAIVRLTLFKMNV